MKHTLLPTAWQPRVYHATVVGVNEELNFGKEPPRYEAHLRACDLSCRITTDEPLTFGASYDVEIKLAEEAYLCDEHGYTRAES
jgi:hypothetical protein